MGEYELLSKIKSPHDVKKLNDEQLEKLCTEIREKLVETVSVNGGHLSPNLGVVELTVALERSFNLPKDSIVWDVGHQAYTHKLLTGRYEQFDTIRKKGGISGFPKRAESKYDDFNTGHSSTSISAAYGIARAKHLMGDQSYTVAVIGDGSFTGGLAFEGMNNSGRFNKNFIVVLNDNQNVHFTECRRIVTLPYNGKNSAVVYASQENYGKNSFTHSAYRKTSEKLSSGRKV